MADTVVVDNGGGGGANFTASTDEVGVNGGTVAHVQHVKLVDGTSNGTDGIQGSAANGLEVDVTRVVPGTGATNLGKAEDTAHVDGDVGILVLGVRNHITGSTTDGDYSAMSVSPTGDLNTIRRTDLQRIAVTSGGLTTTATAYTAGDQVGTQFTFANAARTSGGGGIITGVTLVSAADTIGSMDLVIFDSTVTLAADNAAFAISDADALKFATLIQLSGAVDIGNNRVCWAGNLAIPYVCSGGTSLFGALITRTTIAATPFAATTDILLSLFVERN